MDLYLHKSLKNINLFELSYNEIYCKCESGFEIPVCCLPTQ